MNTKEAWLVTLTSALFFFYVFIQLNLFNAIDVQLMQDFHLNAPQLGQLASMYFYANAIGLLPAGYLLDRYSTKMLLLIAVIMTTVGTFGFGIATTFSFAAMSRFVVGLGSSFCLLGSIRLASRWFTPAKMATVTGIVVVLGMLGGLVAQTPMAILTQHIGWRDAMLFNTGLGLLIFIAIAAIVKDHPDAHHHENLTHKEHLKGLGMLQTIKLAALNPQNWLGGIYTSLLNSPVFILGALWGIHYLMDVRHLTVVKASYATTMLFVGIILGSPLFGWFSDRIGRRVLPMVLGAILSLIVILILIFAKELSLPMILFLFFLVGLVTSSQVLSYPTIAELNPPYLTSTAVSIDSICIMSSGFILQPFFGWIMEFGQDHRIVNGVKIYSAQSFTHAMMMMPIAFIIGLFVTFFIRETFCQQLFPVNTEI